MVIALSTSLSRNEILLLKYIYRNMNSKVIYQNELSKELNLDPKIVSKSLIRLEKMKIISREPVLHNGRKTYVIKADKNLVLKILEESGEDPLTISESLSKIMSVPCISCQYIYKCYEGGFHDPVNCQYLTYYLRNITTRTWS